MASSKREKVQPIHVYLRIKPPSKQEREARSLSCLEILGLKEVAIKQQHGKKYTFDRIFGPLSKQIDIYQSVVYPLIPEVLAGYNCTVFAYGQTGTGKTYTMAGGSTSSTSISLQDDQEAGIIPRALAHLFDELRLQQLEFTVRVSYLELYNEDMYDLLSDGDDNSRLRIYEDQRQKGSVIVQGVEELVVGSKNEVYKILEKGQEKRRTASTLVNAQSSRSHTVFSITVYTKETTLEGEEVVKTGKLNLVDLAGSENISRSGAVELRAREAGSINQSLLTLGRVIKALVERSPHVPYRESKLTRILQDSLGGRTKTSIIATVSSTSTNLEETLSTLEYANRARNITNRPEINQRISKRALLCQYNEEIERLRRDLHAERTGSGIYLAKDNYERLMANTEYQKEEIAEKITVIRELEKKIQNVEQEKAIKEKEWEDLCTSFKQQIEKMETEKKVLEEQTESLATEREMLKEKTETLLHVAEKSTANESKLREKVDQFYDATNRNKESTSKLMSYIDTSFLQIAEEVGECYYSSGTKTRILLDSVTKSEEKMKELMTVLQQITEKQDNAQAVSSCVLADLEKHTERTEETVHNMTSNITTIMEEVVVPLQELMKEQLSELSLLQYRIQKQQEEFEALLSATLNKIDCAKEDAIIKVENILNQVETAKNKFISDQLEIQNGLIKEKVMQEKIQELQNQMVDLQQENMARIITAFNVIEPSFVNFEYQLKEHVKFFKELLKGITEPLTAKQNDDKYRDEFSFAFTKLTAFTDATQDAVTNTLEVFLKMVEKDGLQLRNANASIKEEYCSKIQQLIKAITAAKEGSTSAEEFLASVKTNIKETIRGLNKTMQLFDSNSVTSNSCINKCKRVLKERISKDFITVEPTGSTPGRPCYQFPGFSGDAPRERIVEKFRQMSAGRMEKESVLQESNTPNVSAESSRLDPEKSTDNEDKENIPED